jgi:hypothetical protein
VLSPTFLIFRRILKNYNLQFNILFPQKHLNAIKSKKRVLENITKKGYDRDSSTLDSFLRVGGEGVGLSRSQELEKLNFSCYRHVCITGRVVTFLQAMKSGLLNSEICSVSQFTLSSSIAVWVWNLVVQIEGGT